MPRADRRQTQRVVVTGIGLVTPLGAGREMSWRKLVAGERAPRWLARDELFPFGDSGVDRCVPVNAAWAGGPAPNLAVAGRGAAELARDPVTALALAAARESMQDAGLDGARFNPVRFGCVVGASKGGLRSFEGLAAALHAGDVDGGDSRNRPIPATVWQDFLPHAASTAVAAEFGLAGPVLCPVAACATGLVSLNRGFELVRDGVCDVVLAGSSDASLVPAVLGSFSRLGVLAHGFDDPAGACRPFDRRRTGFIVGEGAAVLVLERLTHALERGAAPYAEWLAAGTATDPAGITQVDASGEALARMIGDVLDRAGRDPREIDYVNLHGTATPTNDLCETRAIHSAFGRHAGSVAASSLKGALGHLLGAAGSVELACTVLALRDGLVPPTANLEDPDPACDLDYTPLVARQRRIDVALKLSLGFGGHLAAAVLGREVGVGVRQPCG
jgi:3-oxoacyl-[acyl-carrier-protein] synthase II